MEKEESEADNEDIIDEEMDKQLMDPESRKWYKRVMRWTKQNRRAYCIVKLFQILVCLSMLGITVAYFVYWKQHKNDINDLMIIIKLLLSMHVFDLLVFLTDLIMVCKRWRTMIALRFILSSVAFSLGVVVQVHFV